MNHFRFFPVGVVSHQPACSRQLTLIFGVAVGMDIDAVDYLEGPLEEGSIWKSMYAASKGMLNFSEGFSGNFEGYPQLSKPAHTVYVLPEEPLV